jgi:hypothetical protein
MKRREARICSREEGRHQRGDARFEEIVAAVKKPVAAPATKKYGGAAWERLCPG